MAYNFSNRIEDSHRVSISDGRTRAKLSDVIKAFPAGVTIVNFDIVKSDKGEFVILIASEMPANYFFGGAAMLRVAKGWVNDFDGDIVACRKELFNAGGVHVKMEYTKLSDGRDYVKLTV